jgi:integrase
MITMTPITMSGVFAKTAEDFIAFKRAQGYKYYLEAKILSRFCRFSEDYTLSEPTLTRELVMDWTAPRKGEVSKSRMHRISVINQFEKHLRLTRHKTHALPPCVGWPKSSFTPYIFTHDEIARLFRAADTILPVAGSRDLHRALPVLFRLLYACGLRVSEAVGLRCRDVDLEKGLLTVRETKNGQDRLTPISKTLREQCDSYRNNVAYWLQDDDYFFPAPDRTILSPNTVYGRFRRILWDAGIPYNGKGNGPRLHDLRHTFAVHTLQQWVKRGEDLTAMLPVLSVFMGHKSMRSTSQYLRLTAEVYPDVVRQVEESCAYVIPGGEA